MAPTAQNLRAEPRHTTGVLNLPSGMGILMASGLMNAGKMLKGVEFLEGYLLPKFFQSYYNGVQSRSKALLGEKTFWMVCIWQSQFCITTLTISQPSLLAAKAANL